MKHLEVRQECSAACHILNSFLDASYRDETLFLCSINHLIYNFFVGLTCLSLIGFCWTSNEWKVVE